MRTMRFFVIVVLSVAVAGTAWWLLAHRANRTSVADARPRVPVATVPVITSNIEMRVMATGNVQAWFDVEVSAQVSDNISVLYVDEGDVVTTGQALVQLDLREINAMCDAAAAARVSTEAAVRQMNASLTNTLRQFGRTQQLFHEKVIGQQEYDDAETAVTLARGRHDVTIAECNRLTAQEKELGVRRERYTVRAPFDGVIAQVHLDSGASVTPSVPVVRMTRISPVKVQVELPETHAPDMRVGQPANVRIWTMAERVFTGTVTRIYPALNARWRTQTVEIMCPNTEGQMRPGMFARAEIITGRTRALLVPDVAVMKLSGSGITHLYTIVDDCAQRIDVTVVTELGAYVAVAGAVQAGQPVVVKGQLRVQTGTPVIVTPTTMLP
ncbi:MAG: efflux RND transporter periplasmic adaptor subunit [bacterium]|nr:efflux RND transporter periplasmic adaptor subunit [bacterium]